VRLLALFIKILLFLLLLGFAVKNSETASVHYLMGWEWQAPLSLVLLIAFALGVLLGLLGCSRQLLRQRRQIGRLRKGAGNGDTSISS
jgi:putative membrane protein